MNTFRQNLNFTNNDDDSFNRGSLDLVNNQLTKDYGLIPGITPEKK